VPPKGASRVWGGNTGQQEGCCGNLQEDELSKLRVGIAAEGSDGVRVPVGIAFLLLLTSCRQVLGHTQPRRAAES
jgi:hypothetical protein